jgi:hypothetical protein
MLKPTNGQFQVQHDIVTNSIVAQSGGWYLGSTTTFPHNMAGRKVQAFQSFSNDTMTELIETLTSESLLHEYSTKTRFLAQSSSWPLVVPPNQIRQMQT